MDAHAAHAASIPPSAPHPAPPPPLADAAALAALRERNRQLQRAIAHVDAAAAHLVAARLGIPPDAWAHALHGARSRREFLVRVCDALTQVSIHARAYFEQWVPVANAVQPVPQPVVWDGRMSISLEQHRAQLRNAIMAGETELVRLNQIQPITPALTQHITALRSEIDKRKLLWSKVTSAIAHINFQTESQLPPPLDRAQFSYTFTRYRALRTASIGAGVQTEQGIDATLAVLQKVPPGMQDVVIDLHRLHVLVLTAGGPARIHHNNLWPFVAGRLGLGVAPPVNQQPVASTPEVAAALERLYAELLHHFDSTYINTRMDTRRKEASRMLYFVFLFLCGLVLMLFVSFVICSATVGNGPVGPAANDAAGLLAAVPSQGSSSSMPSQMAPNIPFSSSIP